MTFPIFDLGESAMTIRLGEAATVELAERAAALAEHIRRSSVRGVAEVVPAVASVTVFYAEAANPARRREELEAVLAQRAESNLETLAFRTHEIPVVYDGADLGEVCWRLGQSREAVIALHAAREYHVLALGFLPGWAYLGPLDPALKLPRRETPRTRVPAGAVAIMGEQTGIYPRVTPGGWHLIGSTDVVLFDPGRTPPALFRAGDRVRFIPES